MPETPEPPLLNPVLTLQMDPAPGASSGRWERCVEDRDFAVVAAAGGSRKRMRENL